MIIPNLSRKQQLLTVSSVLSILALIIWALMRYISPSPPSQVTMTTGSVDGAYYLFGEKYKTYLKANGIDLILKSSAGSVENLDRLQSATADVGFIQGGLGILTLNPTGDEDSTPLRSLSVIAYEPIWIFTQSPAVAKQLNGSLLGMRGKRIAVGAPGSGTRKVARELLETYGITEQNSQFVNTSGFAATEALLSNQLDLIIQIAAPQSPIIKKLLDPSNPATLISLAQSEGLTRKLPYLSTVSLKSGSVDIPSHTPPQDILLLTTTANLVVRQDVHPAIAYLFLEAAREIHHGATLLNRTSEFPHPRGTDFPLAEEATRYYKEGRPFLQRYLPFWLANAIQRMLLILIPLAAVGFPVIKLIPELLNFKEKNRLYRRYADLLTIEHQIRAKQLNQIEIQTQRKALDRIEQDISKMKFSLEFADRVYTLRQHVDYVRMQLLQEQKQLDALTQSA